MNKRAQAALVVTFVLIGVYYWLFQHYALNIPKWDDHAFKKTVENYEKAATWADKLQVIYVQHNEHRVSLTRIVAIVDYKIFGDLDYKRMMLFGSLALLVIWWLLTRFFRPLPGAIWYALPLATFWFSLAFWENTFWGMASVQNFWVVALAVVTFWRLSRPVQWWWGIPAAFIGVFSSGNGVLILPIGLLLLLIQKRWKIAGIWLAISALTLILYFYDYKIPPVTFEAKEEGIRTVIKSFLLFCGSMAEALPFGNVPFQMPLLVGALTVVVSFFLLLYILRSYWKRHFVLDEFDYFYLGGVLFALATAALVTYTRLGMGMEVMLTSRYKMYSALLISFNVAYLTMLVSPKFRDVLNTTFLVVAAFLYVCNQHYYLYDSIQLRKYNMASCFNWQSGAKPNPNDRPIYRNPRLFLDKLDTLRADTTGVVAKPMPDNIYRFDRPAYRNRDLRDGGLYVVFVNNENRYVFPTTYERKHSFRNLLNYNRLFIRGATVNVNLAELKPGKYLVKTYDETGLKNDPNQWIEAKSGVVKALKMNW
jgi:hypothetical protein